MLPLNLAFLAAYVRKHGHEIHLLDYQANNFDMSIFVHQLQEFKPDVIGFSCLTPNIKLGHAIAEIVKKFSPEILTVVGGPHATAMPRETLIEFPAFDIACVGEGEVALLKICDLPKQALERNQVIPSSAKRVGKDIIENCDRVIIENLDEIGMPAYDLLDLEHSKRSMRGYSSQFMRVAELITSRGCPFGCVFCASFVSTGKRHRTRSPESVIAEAKMLHERYNIMHFNIIDDTFTVRKDHVLAIAHGIHELGCTWNCWAHAATLDRELLVSIKALGCTGLLIGVESGSPRVLARLNKGLSRERIISTFKLVHEIGFKNVEANFIVGSVLDETLQDIAMTKTLIREIKPSILAVSVICPYPGTSVFKTMQQNSLIFSYDWNHYVCYGQLPLWRTINFSPRQLVKIQGQIMAGFYFRPSTILRRFRQAQNLSEIAYYIRGGILFIRDLLGNYFHMIPWIRRQS
jgi:radical SAM superfamily enzyme YgiQ (UPF0313 family)